jgi:glutathione S-transferase
MGLVIELGSNAFMTTHLREHCPPPAIDRADTGSLPPDRSVVLYHFGPSICSQKVRLTLAAKNVKWENREVDLFLDENLGPEYMRINHRGVVPTLIDAGYTVFDSATIMRYIDLNFPGASLVPEDDEKRKVMRHWLDVQDQFPIRGLSYGNVKGLLGKLVRSDTPKRIGTINRLLRENPDLAADYEAKLRDTEQWLDEQGDTTTVNKINADMESLLDQLSRQIENRQWIVGEEFTLADIAWMTILARIDFVGMDSVMWGGGKRPAIEAYYERLRKVPSFDAEITHYQNRIDMFKRILKVHAFKLLRLA